MENNSYFSDEIHAQIFWEENAVNFILIKISNVFGSPILKESGGFAREGGRKQDPNCLLKVSIFPSSSPIPRRKLPTLAESPREQQSGGALIP